mgnify:CR=1 FL=1
MKLQSNKQPEFLTYEDLKEKLGYKTYTPKIGSLGKALIKAAKSNHRSIGWVNKQLDLLFNKKMNIDKRKINDRSS